MRVGFLVLGRHEGKGGLENVLLQMVNGLSARGVASSVFFLQPFKDGSYKESFKSHYEFAMPSFLLDKHPLRPRALYYSFLGLGLKKILGMVPGACDVLVVLNVEPLCRFKEEFDKFKRDNPKIPLVSWPHGTLSLADSGDICTALSVFDAHLAISEGLMNELVVNFSQENVNFVGNPVREAPIVPRETRRFVFVGRTDPEKQVPELIRALSGLKGDWSLDVIGGSMTKGRDEELKELVAELGLEGKVKLHGWQQDPWSLVENAGVFLLNSKFEGFGLVLVEAMMRGIPCVSSDCPVGPASIIKPGVNGWLFDLDNYAHCVEILQGILDGQIQLPSEEIVKQSVAEFSSERVFDRFQSVLQNILLQAEGNGGIEEQQLSVGSGP